MHILFATGNKAKIRVMESLLNKYNIKVISQRMDFEEIQDLNINNVAIHKAKQAIGKINEIFIVDDSGLYIPSLQNFPGSLLKPVLDTIKDYGICELLKHKEDKGATFSNTFVICNPNNNTIKSFSLNLGGTISQEPRGSSSFGWGIERIFIPVNSCKTIAEHSRLEWDKYWKSQAEGERYKSFVSYLVDLLKSYDDTGLNDGSY